jgi:hypothetical protein
MEPAKLNRSDVAALERSLQAVQRYHNTGTSELKKGKHYGAPGTASEKEKLRKARAFADPAEGFSENELGEVLDRCRQHSHVLSVSHFVKLVTVEKGPQRDQILNEVMNRRLSASQLSNLLRERFGNRKPAAGRIKSVNDWDEARLEILKLTDQWRRLWSRRRTPADRSEDPVGRFQVPRSKKLERELWKLNAQIVEVQEVLEKQLRRLRR